MTRKMLSQEDVDQLLSDPSGESRTQTAAKIAQDFDSDDLEYLLTKMGQLPPDTLNAA